MFHSMNFNELRKKHKQFIYEGYEIKEENGSLKVFFNFLTTPNIRFQPKITFPHVKWEAKFENLVFNLGMVELISYWKATCSPEIVIKAGHLNDEQIKWWKDLLIKGLGEFFYKNQIDFTHPELVDIVCHPEPAKGEARSFQERLDSGSIKKMPKQVWHDTELKDRNLILVGGGKDSAVTMETLRMSEKDFNCLMLNPTQAARDMVEAGGCKNSIIVSRTIDPKLLELNKQGYLNGHTPFSAYLAFLSTLAAVLYDYKNIVVSNEASSNEGNVEYHGQIINHQYSKSFEFEEKFRDYSKKYLSSETNYYSYLRSQNELEIARQFSKLEKYHQIFRSCNVGSKAGIWCGECSKCLFAYIILFPFLGNQLKEIFGKDLLDDEKLTPIMEELLQLPGKFKPFECVGTKEEIEYVMLLCILKLKGKNLPYLLKKFKNRISVLILGMGREGQSVMHFLKKYVPDIKIGTADQKNDKNYLNNLINYDVIIKSPGIPYLPEILRAKENGKIISSVTQIFFDLFKGKITGVTGTKGKSTTASLIYGVLKSGGLDVYLAGNIGKPALDLLEKTNENSIVVYELSSFQLADLQKSPHIAVITNIYPDHLDYHGSFENYKTSKENIGRFQTKKDILISNKDGVEAAKVVGRLFKIPESKINEAIKNFKQLPHRLEFIAEKKGIRFYNDSLATNPHATMYGLKILGSEVETLIIGGYDRGVDYSVLGPVIAKSKIKILILFPVTGERIWQALRHSGLDPESIKKFDVTSMEEAVKIAFDFTSSGKICLLSPASASFNMFKDYADRGDQFKKLVKEF